MLRTPTGAILALALLVLAGRATDAQTPSVADAALATQNAAFLALPEGTRKAAQDALVWLGFYNGVVDGDFGPRRATRFSPSRRAPRRPPTARSPPPSSWRCSPPPRRRATRSGSKLSPTPRPARKPAFQPDLSAGATGRGSTSPRAPTPISAPSTPASPPRRQAAGSPTRRSNPTLSSSSRGRTGRRPSIPVRQERGGEPADSRVHLRLSCIAGRPARPDRARGRQFVRAVSASPPRAASRRRAGGAVAPGLGWPRPRPTPRRPHTALIVAPGKALTALKAGDCPNPTVGGKPVRLERTDAATNLAMIAGDFGPRAKRRASARRRRMSSCSALPDSVLPRARLVLRRRGTARHRRRGGGERRRRTGVRSARRAGRARRADRGRAQRIAGVALAAPHAVIAPDAIRAFLGAGIRARGAPDLSAGDIAAREKEALVAVFCQK